MKSQFCLQWKEWEHGGKEWLEKVGMKSVVVYKEAHSGKSWFLSSDKEYHLKVR